MNKFIKKTRSQNDLLNFEEQTSSGRYFTQSQPTSQVYCNIIRSQSSSNILTEYEIPEDKHILGELTTISNRNYGTSKPPNVPQKRGNSLLGPHLRNLMHQNKTKAIGENNDLTDGFHTGSLLRNVSQITKRSRQHNPMGRPIRWEKSMSRDYSAISLSQNDLVRIVTGNPFEKKIPNMKDTRKEGELISLSIDEKLNVMDTMREEHSDEHYVSMDKIQKFNDTGRYRNILNISMDENVLGTQWPNNCAVKAVSTIESPNLDILNNEYACINIGTILKQANMDDILIFSRKSGESVKLWVEYFISYFQQISKQTNVKPYKIKTVYLEDALKPCVEDKEFIEGATGVKLQLVIVCPDFLEFIAEHPKESANLLKILLPDRTLALLLGVTDADLTDVHKNAIPSYFQWQRQSVGRDQDQTFTKEFLNQGRTILYKIWKQQSLVIAQEKTSFSVTPKKIRQGQNSIFIILNYPLQKEDIVKIQIERNGELEEIKTMKRRNPYMIKISVPENLTEVTAIVNILVEKNGSIVGSRPIKVESKLKELEQILKSSNNPVEFMCQTLGFSPADREHLDNSLVQGFQKNLPPHLNLLGSHSTPFEASKSVHKHSNEEFPTLLHFAARFGLEKLAMQLMDCPGADVAYEVRNVFDMTPPEIADANGFHSLSSSLKGYMCMNDLATAYTKMEELSLKHSDYLDENGYLQATVVQNLYKTLPPPRPVNPQTTNAIVHTPTSDCGSSWYLANDRAPINYSREDLHKNPEDSEAHLKSEQHRRNLKSPPPNAQKSNTPAIIEDKYLNELAEIINDFKNKVHSLDQVEKLVEEWKSRNDVQKSWKEKQDQLNEMRLRVDKLHRETKKPGAVLSIIKKVFSRHRKPVSISEEKEDEITSLKNVISMPPFQLNQSCRPISSLSTSSSGSSARMSTISGCSIGDSGTHSDNEERKMTFASQPDHLFNKVLLEMNYNMVPAPRPVRDPNRNPWETIEENRPNTRPDTQQVYIQFPPNGQPVEGLAGMDQSQQEYMNIPSSQNYQHEYINYKPAS